MAERNKTIIWTIILIALIVGVLLIPIPKGSTDRILLFSDYFDEDELQETKWDWSKTVLPQTVLPNHELTISQQPNRMSTPLSTKYSYEADILVFSIEFKNDAQTEEENQIVLRSSASNLNEPSNLYNYVGITFKGYVEGNIQVTYVTQDMTIHAVNTTQWNNDTWYKMEITMQTSTHEFSIKIGQDNGDRTYSTIYNSGFSDWYSKSEPIYAQILIGQLGLVSPIMPEVRFTCDNVEIFSEASKSPSLNLFLIYLAIISFLLIIYGSLVNANCKHYHILATSLGVLGFCMIGALLLNVWMFTTWSLLTALVAMWSMITLIVHENWEIDYSYYEETGKWAMVIGIIFTVITFIEYFTLYLTQAYTPIWWG